MYLFSKIQSINVLLLILLLHLVILFDVVLPERVVYSQQQHSSTCSSQSPTVQCKQSANTNRNVNNISSTNHHQTATQYLSRSLVSISNGQVAAAAAAATTTPQPPPQEQPDFQEPIGNHTVAMGRDAYLSCKINNLGNLKTAWLRVEDKGILTIHNNVITRNYRIHLINDGKNFILNIKNVQPTDKGGYMCQINSVPMRYAVGYLDVLTPPVFDDPTPAPQGNTDHAAGKVTISEGGNATLSCRAKGHPSPVITWRREDNKPILLDSASSSSEESAKVEGPTIMLSSVSRVSSGAYLCIASNGVQPAASKRQVLDVQYKPVVTLPEIEMRAQLNQLEATLTCNVELNPIGSYYWAKVPAAQLDSPGTADLAADDATLIENDVLFNSDKFEIVIKQVNGEKVQMLLTIRQVEKQDFGLYKCIARNSLGLQSNSIRLVESSSFSISNMFRGGGSLGSHDSELRQQQQQQQQPQNDQQDLPPQANRPAKSTQGGILSSPSSSRTHTRSSWTQRVSGINKQDPDTNQLLSAVGSSAMSSRSVNAPGGQLMSLLFARDRSPSLLLSSLSNCFLLITAQLIVVVFFHRHSQN